MKIITASCLIMTILFSSCLPRVSSPNIEPSDVAPISSTPRPVVVPPMQINPTNTQVQSIIAYPIESVPSSTYPIAETHFLPSGITRGPDFQIDLPLRAGTTLVTGSGPAGLPILLVDINLLDTVYSETIIDAQGRFTFDLVGSLSSGTMVGIKLGDVEGTKFDPNNFVYNDNYTDRYLIGILFDTAQVVD